MSQPEPKQIPRSPESATLPSKVANNTAESVPRPFEAASLFKDTLEDAERLLKYAAEAGIEVETDIRNGVLQARAAFNTGWNETTAANLLASLTRLAVSLKPVTAESLKVSDLDAKKTWRSYWIVAILLAAIIIPYSLASFVTSSISDAIRKDIVTANELAVKLTGQLGSSSAPPSPSQASAAGSTTGFLVPAGVNPTDVVAELQTLAATIRDIDTRSGHLNTYILRSIKDPFGDIRSDANALKNKLQLPVPLPAELTKVAEDRISVYQDVRYFGQNIVDEVSVFYGAFATSILPVLYALLGTCVYLLRNFEQERCARTFTPSHADFHRFFIAGIAGAVIGLFSNFTNNFTITQATTSSPVGSPLAIAFVVGYAVDVFFSFMEGLVQAFTKKTTLNVASQAQISSGKR
jgi:hypothetical protein